jgi:aspartate/methionine/tyrosine aminotransferase
MMNTHAAVIERYFAAWNETDPEHRRELIAQTWTEDAAYIDPLMEGTGHVGIDAMIGAVQTQFPGHLFRLTSPIDAHHDRVRFTWELAAENGVALVKGTDFGLIVGERLQSVTGFLDQVPQP